jgi:hypothetical protein
VVPPRKLHAVAHELRPDHLGLGRPDVLLQPGHQRQVVSQPTQQRHRVVRVAVDQARDQRVLGKLDPLARRIGDARVGDWQDRLDLATVDRDRVLLQHYGMRLDRNHPTGFDEQVDLGGGWVHCALA